MKRMYALLSGLALVLCGSACSMCQHPFDYARPVIQPGVCPTCGANLREGSAFTGGQVVSSGSETAPPIRNTKPSMTPASSEQPGMPQ